MCLAAAGSDSFGAAPEADSSLEDSLFPQPDPAYAEAFARQVDSVLAGNYRGADAAALLARVQEKLKWGEKNDRLLEAEGILIWNRGDWQLAMSSFSRLSQPSAPAMRLLAEGYARKGEKYEAAAWYLRAAQAYGIKDSMATSMYRKYLEVKPGDVPAELNMARGLEERQFYPEALAIYLSHPDVVAGNLKATLRVGALLVSLDRQPEAAKLYQRAREIHARERELPLRIARIRETLGQRAEAAEAWIEAWSLDPPDTASRNRGLAHLEATGQAPRLKALLEKTVEADPANHALRFKLAVACLRENDRASAYFHLAQALKAAPDNPTYQSRLPDVIAGDSLIQTHFTYLKSASEKPGSTPHLLRLAARGHSLAGNKRKACQVWIKAYDLAPLEIQGGREELADLSACGDPASLTLAARLGEKLPDQVANRETDLLLLRAFLHEKRNAQAAGAAVKLIRNFPDEAGAALDAAKTLLAIKDTASARQILMELAGTAKSSGMVPGPETALLLSGIFLAEKDCNHALEYLSAAKDQFPEAGRNMGACLMELKDLQSAAREYEGDFARKQDRESLRKLARIYLDLGEAGKEKAVLDTLAAHNWASEPERLRLGLILAEQGDSAEASELFGGLLRSRSTLPPDSGWAEASLFLGARLAGEKKYDKAAKFLVMGLKSFSQQDASNPRVSGNLWVADRSRVAAWRLLGDTHAARNQWKEAWTAYQSGFAMDSLNPGLARSRLQAAKKSGGKKELSLAYRDMARLDSTHEEANAFLAKAHLASREYREAAFYYRRLALARPQDGNAWAGLGNSLALIPSLAEASDPLQKAIDLGVTSDEIYINRARAYRYEGAKDMAASILEYLLALNPKNYLAVLASAKFAAEDGNGRAAAELAKRAGRLTPVPSPWLESQQSGGREARAIP